jgi:hypothetical protein
LRNTFLIITSIADQSHPLLNLYAKESQGRGVHYIIIGDTLSPKKFKIDGCHFLSVGDQKNLPFTLAEDLPLRHYSRKNLGYLIAISKGAEIIIETDDDNYPETNFWRFRSQLIEAKQINHKGWVNAYRYFTEKHIWPRGFSLEHIKDELLPAGVLEQVNCPIQQGLANGNPDVDAIFRLTRSLPISFKKNINIALGKDAICPFNSQNTTWFREAFPLLYLPSYCSFRMTDIWRSFVAQRIAWTCDWSVLFHSPTVIQERNEHHLLKDLKEEFDGYVYNAEFMNRLIKIRLKKGQKNILVNMQICYQELIQAGYFPKEELTLLDKWVYDIKKYL